MTHEAHSLAADRIGKVFRFQQLEDVFLPGLRETSFTISTLTDECSQYVCGITVEARPDVGTALCDTLSFAMTEKTEFSRLAGAETPWRLACAPEFVMVDEDLPGVTVEVLEKLSEVQVVVLDAPAGESRPASLPQWLANQLEAHLSGFTEREEAFDLREVRAFLIRTICDVYHQRPHSALGGETPADTLSRHLDQYSLPLPPYDHDRIPALGRDGTGVIGERGVEFAGLRFDSTTLQMARDEGVESIAFKYSPFELFDIYFQHDGMWSIAYIVDDLPQEAILLGLWDIHGKLRTSWPEVARQKLEAAELKLRTHSLRRVVH